METTTKRPVPPTPQAAQQQRYPQPGQPIYVKRQTNPLGTAGFICALLGLFLCWVPVLGWLLWIAGAVCSIVGLFKSPKGLAIAGTIISFIGILILLFVGSVIAGILL